MSSINGSLRPCLVAKDSTRRLSMIAVPAIAQRDIDECHRRSPAIVVMLSRVCFRGDDAMQNKVVVLSLTVLTVTALVIGLAAQAIGPELPLVTRAADALGGATA